MMLTRRESPVVWGDSKQFTSYAKNGYLQRPGFFNRLELDAARFDAMTMRENYTGDGIIYENEDEKTVRSLFGIHDCNHRIEDLLITPDLVKLASEILDSDVYVHQLHINYKQAFVGGGFFWHSDYTYWHWEDGMPHPRCLSMIIPLEEMCYENGPMYVHSGSHMFYGHSEFYRNRRFHPDDEIKHDDEDPGGATDDQLMMLADDETRHRNQMHVILGSPGDLCVMDANLLHMSGPNWSPFDRMCAFVCLNSTENILGKPYSGRPRRPRYITNRNVKPLNWIAKDQCDY